MLGFSVVLATATGTLYFVDTSGVAARQGLDAVGVLLLLLNAAFLLLMVFLIARAGRHDAMQYAKRALQRLKATPSSSCRPAQQLSMLGASSSDGMLKVSDHT